MRTLRMLMAAALVLAIVAHGSAYAGASPAMQYSKTLVAATSATAGTGASFTGPALSGAWPVGSRIGPRRVLISCTATAAAYFEGTVTFYTFNDNGAFLACRDVANLSGGSAAVQLKGWEPQQAFDFVGDGPDSASITVSAGTAPKVTFKW